MAAANKNFIDNVVSLFSPEAGLRRARARAALQIVERSFDGAKIGRRTGGWTTAGTSANAEIAPALSTLRNRSRDLVRNNPLAKKAFKSRVSNTVGTGIMAKLSDGQDIWDKWIKECDADGQLDFYGLQALVDKTIEQSGECLVRFRYRLLSDGLPVPLQLQVLEPDYLDNIKNENLKNGGWIQNGIEYDAIGRRVAYWLYKQHPGDIAPILNTLISYRVDAADVLHIYEKDRPGQSRGVPRNSSVMLKMRDLDDYEEAELVRKGIEACFAAFVHTSDESLTVGTPEAEGGTSTRRLETLAPGMINYLKTGEEVSFGAPNTVQGYNEYIRSQKHDLAAGSDVTYEQMTGDLSQVNYSSIRAGTLEFRKEIEQFRWLTFIPMFCDQVVKAWARSAKLAGKIKNDDITVSWTPTRWDWVDPVKDMTGELLEIAAGLKPWSEGVRSRGFDPDANIKEIAEEQAKFKDNKIQIDINGLALGAASSPANNTDQKT